MVGGNILKNSAADQLCYQCILAKAQQPSDSESLLLNEHNNKSLSLVDLIRPTPIRLLPITISVFDTYTLDDEEEKQEVQSVSTLEQQNEPDGDDDAFDNSLVFDCSFAESLREDGARHPEPQEGDYDGDISYLSHEMEEMVLSMIMHQNIIRPVAAVRPARISREV
jgi:hypothetical protein